MPAAPPQFLDQRCFNLVKAKKGIKRTGRCQIFSGYALIALNAFSILQNLFFILTVNAWNEIPVQDNSGKVHRVDLNTGGLVFLTLLKTVVNLLLMKWGFMALQTFKPIVKDLNRQELAASLGNQN